MIAGQTFHRWTTLRPTNGGKQWLCCCDCGAQKAVWVGHLLQGNSKSCGCLVSEVTSARNTTHGMGSKVGHNGAQHPVYTAWLRMRAFCFNPNNPSYKNYGARGIKVCRRWLKFSNFRDDMLPTWQTGLSIGRKNNDGNYTPRNCRWETNDQQAANKQNTVRVKTPKGKMTLMAAAEAYGIRLDTLRMRHWRGDRGARLVRPLTIPLE